jgi:hypothetical protein
LRIPPLHSSVLAILVGVSVLTSSCGGGGGSTPPPQATVSDGAGGGDGGGSTPPPQATVSDGAGGGDAGSGGTAAGGSDEGAGGGAGSGTQPGEVTSSSIDLRRTTGFSFMHSQNPQVDTSRNAASSIAWTVNDKTYRPTEIQIQYGPNGAYAAPGSFDPATEMYQIFTWVPGPSPSSPNATLFLKVPPDAGVHALSTGAEADKPYVLACANTDSQVGCSRLRGTVTVDRINIVGDSSAPGVPAVVDISVTLAGSWVQPTAGTGTTTVDLPVTGRVESCVDQGHTGTGCQQVSGGRLVTGKDRGEDESSGAVASGFDCLSGTWRRAICSGAQQAKVTFSGGRQGTGTFSDVDCTNSCTRSFAFNYNATSESSMTIQYTSGQICSTPQVPGGGTQAWSCTDNQLMFGNLYGR